MQYPVVFEKNEDGGWTTTCPLLPGCISEGDTREEAKRNIKDAIHLYLRAVKKEKMELVRGSGNVYRDFGVRGADLKQLKAILASEIIKTLDRDGLSVRGAHDRTGIAAADFSRIRNAALERFTIDRLMSIINKLGSRVEVKVRVRRADAGNHAMAA